MVLRWLKRKIKLVWQGLPVTIVGALVVGFFGLMWDAHRAAEKTFGRPPTGSKQDWGTYGDYLGGVVGTYASLASVCLLFLAYFQQSQLLRHAQNQGVREELQRLISSISKNIDELLDAPRVRPRELMALHPRPASLSTTLRAAIKAFDTELQAGMVTQSRCAAIARDETVVALSRELSRFEWCLGQFRKHEGSPVLPAFYGSHYGGATLLIHVVFRSDFPEDSVENMGLAANLPEWRELIRAIDAKP